jgi:hypothetical protein
MCIENFDLGSDAGSHSAFILVKTLVDVLHFVNYGDSRNGMSMWKINYKLH